MKRLLIAACVMATLTVPARGQLTRDGAGKPAKELIAVWIGSVGTDTSFIPMLREMEKAVRIEAAATRRTLVLRGVSLEPDIDDGVKHLAQVAHFDEISVGGNWTNSMVARYLGPDIGKDSTSAVPQLILLERNAGWISDSRLTVSPEREIKRFIGLGEIATWIKAGSPLPKP